MYLSKTKYEKKLRKIKMKNIDYNRKIELKNAKQYTYFNFPSVSKLVLFVVFLLCIQIIMFCEYIVWKTGDSSALYTLIGVPVTLVPTVIAYYQKSTKENTVGGIVYESVMKEKAEG